MRGQVVTVEIKKPPSATRSALICQSESGNLKLNSVRFDLAATFRSTVAAMGIPDEIAVRVDLPPAPVEIDGDEGRICQLVRNILDNAVRYTPPGGEISVGARDIGQNWPGCWGTKTRRFDTGPGWGCSSWAKTRTPRNL